MAGKSTKRGSRQNQDTAKPGGVRGRKPAVPPIIDLQATEVGASQAAAEADDVPPAKEEPAPSQAPGTDAPDDSADDPEKPWMERMKAFLLSGVHVGNVRVPAAGLLVLIGLFGAGLVLGRFALPQDPPMTDARGPDAVGQRLETALGDVATTTTALNSRFEQLERKLDAATDHAKSSEVAADAALDEVRKIDTAMKSLAAKPAAGSDAPNEAVSALQAQVAELAAKIDRLSPAVAGAQGLSAAAEKRIDEIAETVAALKTAVDSSGAAASEAPAVDVGAIARASNENMNAALETLEAKLQQRFRALEDKLSVAPAAGSGALPRAVVALEAAAVSGSSFTGELDTVARLMPQDPALAALRPHATTGVATRDALAGDLATLAALAAEGEEATAGTPGKQDTGVLSSFMDKVNNLVEIRKVDTADRAALGKAAEAARSLVAKGDLGRAADAIEAAGKGSDQAAKWVARARARVETDTALAALTRRALQGVAAQGDGSG